MNPLKKNKYLQVFLISSGLTSLYLAFGFFIPLWHYQVWSKVMSIIFTVTLPFFAIYVVVINVYSLTSLIFSKIKKKAMPLVVVVGPAISFTILVGYAVAPYIQVLPNGSHLQPFDSELWISNDYSILDREGITHRQKMLGDVVENILPGKSRNEIIRLLGLSSDDSLQPTLRFYLGPARGAFFGQVEWLKVYLDSSGHFAKYEIFWDD